MDIKQGEKFHGLKVLKSYSPFFYHCRIMLEINIKKKESHSVMSDSATPGTIQSMKFSRPEYCSGQLFSSPGHLPNPGIEPRCPSLQANSLPAEPPGKPKYQKIFENNRHIFQFNVTFTKRDLWLSHWSRNKEQRIFKKKLGLHLVIQTFFCRVTWTDGHFHSWPVGG